MEYNRLFLIFLVLIIVFSSNTLFATNMDDNSMEISDNSDITINTLDLNSSYKINDDDVLSENSQSDLISKNDEYIIYVGSNSEKGNGSELNPFSSFDLACENISNGKKMLSLKYLMVLMS